MAAAINNNNHNNPGMGVLNFTPQMNDTFAQAERAIASGVGTFRGSSIDNIKTFVKKVNKHMDHFQATSKEIGHIISTWCLQGHAKVAFEKWMSDDINFPNAEYWCPQEAIAARPYQRYQPRIPRIAEVAAHDIPPGAPGNPGEHVLHVDLVQEVPEQESIPELQAIKAEPEVTEEQCLRQYLLTEFETTLSLEAVETHFATFKTMKNWMSVKDYLHRLQTAIKAYHEAKFTDEMLASPTYPAFRDRELLGIALIGFVPIFKKHIDNLKINNHDKCQTFAQLVIEAKYWETQTDEGRKYFANCKECPPYVSSLSENNQENNEGTESETQEEQTTVNSATRGRGTTRGRGGRGRGQTTGQDRGRGRGQSRGRGGRGRGKPPTPFENALRSDQPLYWQNIPPQYKTNTNQPQCFYCGLTSHSAKICPNLRDDMAAGIMRQFHPDRGNIAPRNQQQKKVNAFLAENPNIKTAIMKGNTNSAVTQIQQRQQQLQRPQKTVESYEPTNHLTPTGVFDHYGQPMYYQTPYPTHISPQTYANQYPNNVQLPPANYQIRSPTPSFPSIPSAPPTPGFATPGPSTPMPQVPQPGAQALSASWAKLSNLSQHQGHPPT